MYKDNRLILIYGIKIQPNTMDLSMRLQGIDPTNSRARH